MPDPAIPSLSISSEGDINITISSTNALLYEQGYTYNQAGFTYNQAGVSYGGIYNTNQDIVPILSQAFLEYPTLSFADIYIAPPIGPFSLGPGFFMFIPQ